MPEWSITLGGGISDSLSKLERKEQELRLADIVVVPSKFVMGSLPAWVDRSKVVMAPFGSPVQKVTNTISIKKNILGRPLRVLFAGSMGQRKGLGDLFTAIKLLNNPNVELVVMGSLQAPIKFYKDQLASFIYEPGRPQEDVLALMRSCDVFCLPSIVEGRALVMQEAMSQGLPLIITPNTGGEDLIIEGVTGFLVPICSPESIAEKISWFLNNRSKLPGMSIKAQQHAKQYTWDNYEKQIVESILNLLST
jgi:glycosyltransferase involved in cell wall biosynthesis